MFKSLTLGIILALSSACASNPTVRGELTDRYYLEFACDALGEDCTGLKTPEVNRSAVLLDEIAREGFTLFGMYILGEETVYVNGRFGLKQQQQTLVHEMVHYIQWKLNEETYDRCLSEQDARLVHHLWAGTQYTTDWHESYQCFEYAVDDEDLEAEHGHRH
jgi:hypothetical protein